ncbi:MAG: calcium/sodium antiporter [Gammaproteobacteria bacterium]|nr:calcium/sodium antiporter [Gammaproteobacteria bacterium]NVK87215.1 calcium/sodium antiporter [Gammaproteobacteria bacterium]
MVSYFALVVSGIALLVWSADRFTDGAAALARNLGVSPLIVGLTIVAIGSSAPEIFISLNASLSNNPEIGLGNAIGSNITNIAFVLGISAMIKPLHVESGTIKREFPVLLGITLWASFLLLDGDLTALESWPLIIGLVIYVSWLIRVGMKTRVRQDLMLQEIVDELPDTMTNARATMWIVIGMILLQISSKMLVYGASNIAAHFGISDLIIGSTIIAIGTSLPELAASVAGVLKDEDEMALGNVIGSNIFNLLAVLSLPGIITGIEFAANSQNVIYLNVLPMIGLTVAMGIMGYGFGGRKGHINRIEGCLLVGAFITWLALSAMTELGHL